MKALAGILVATTAAAAPYAPLRAGATAHAIFLTTGDPQTNKECTYVRRDASGVLQLVLRCHYARALKLTAKGNRVVLSQFSQQGAQFVVVITGNVISIEPAPHDATTIPLGWNVEYNEGNVTLADRYNVHGGALQRGTYDAKTKQWTWAEAFGARFPTTGQISMPLFLPYAGDPTIVYAPRTPAASDLAVRLGDGAEIDVPPWDGGPTTTTSRVSYSSAVVVNSQVLPAIAAKVAEQLVVAFPIARRAWQMRSLEGAADFSDPPPPANAAQTHGMDGPRCSEVKTPREHEQVFAPQLFEWNGGVGLAYLATRTTETMRWMLVAVAGATPAEDHSGCAWVTESHESTNELVIAHLDADGATEAMRIPVEYSASSSNGFHGVGLSVARAGKVLHTVATTYGVETYTRIELP